MGTKNKYLKNFLYIKQKSGLYKVYFSPKDFNRIKNMKWRIKPHPNSNYCVTEIDGKSIHMHRYIMSFPINGLVDHINRNTLDNRTENLRIVNYGTNNHNVSKKPLSGFSGVYLNHGKFVAKIGYNRKWINLGRFSSLREAIYCRRRAERIYYPK